MAKPLEKIIDLIKKTGDNCIVLDHEGNPAYAVIKFEDYQNLVLGKAEIRGLTEDQLIEKINQDVAVWKEATDQQNLENWQSVDDAAGEAKSSATDYFFDEKPLSEAKKEKTGEKSEEKYYFEPID